jgi:hypothetical protein
MVIYIRWTISLSRVSISAFLVYLRLAICATQKIRHALCSRSSIILCRPSLAILPVPLSRLAFHLHPFIRSSALTPLSPHCSAHVLRSAAPVTLSPLPTFLEYAQPCLPVSRLPVFSPTIRSCRVLRAWYFFETRPASYSPRWRHGPL